MATTEVHIHPHTHAQTHKYTHIKANVKVGSDSLKTMNYWIIKVLHIATVQPWVVAQEKFI